MASGGGGGIDAKTQVERPSETRPPVIWETIAATGWPGLICNGGMGMGDSKWGGYTPVCFWKCVEVVDNAWFAFCRKTCVCKLLLINELRGVSVRSDTATK